MLWTKDISKNVKNDHKRLFCGSFSLKFGLLSRGIQLIPAIQNHENSITCRLVIPAFWKILGLCTTFTRHKPSMRSFPLHKPSIHYSSMHKPSIYVKFVPTLGHFWVYLPKIKRTIIFPKTGYTSVFEGLIRT